MPPLPPLPDTGAFPLGGAVGSGGVSFMRSLVGCDAVGTRGRSTGAALGDPGTGGGGFRGSGGGCGFAEAWGLAGGGCCCGGGCGGS